MEDFQFVLNTLQHCKRIYFLPEPIYHYIQVDSSPLKKNQRNHNRMAKIPNIEEYLKPFENLLSNHKNVLVTLYFLMIREKLREQSPIQIAVTSEQFQKSIYATDEYLALCSSNEKKLAEQLRGGRYTAVYFSFIKTRLKTIVKHIAKKTRAYKWIKR